MPIGGITSSSLNRRSPKRKDISDEDLFEAVRNVLPYVRVKHVLPKGSVVLQTAYHRGLFQKPFPLDVASGDNDNVSSSSWVRTGNRRRHRDYVRPRLFFPYCDEAKVFTMLNVCI